MSKLTISLAQMTVVAGDMDGNKQQFEQMVPEAAQRQSDLVIFPELFTTGYVLEDAEAHASTLDAGHFAAMAARAADCEIAIMGSMLEQRENGVSNSLTVYDKAGALQGVYRKLHLFRLFDEEKYLTSGDTPVVLDMPWGKTGLAICYDLRFPEIFRRYAVQDDVTMIIITAEWPLIRMAHWRALLIARAIENQCFVVACNAVGDTGDAVMGGHSMIIDPWGRIVIEAGETSQLITAELDLSEVDRARSKIPVFDDIRHDLYTY